MAVLVKKTRKQHGEYGVLNWFTVFFVFTSCSFSTLVSASPSYFTGIKVGLIFEEPSPKSLPQYFLSLLSKFNNESLESHYGLEGIVLKWDTRQPPLSNIKIIKEEILEKNISVVYSFLDCKSNELFGFLMRGSYVPVVVVWSQNSQWMSESMNESLILSMAPSKQLQAMVIKNLILEFDQSRFTCITTSSNKNDPLWTYLFEYVVNDHRNVTQAFPRCLILEKTDSVITQLHQTLSAVRASGIRIIVIHAEASQTSKILEIAQKISLSSIGEKAVWILTDIALKINALYVPEGSLGIAKAFDEKSAAHGVSEADILFKLLLFDAVTVLRNSLSRILSKRPDLLLEDSENGLTVSSRKELYREMLRCSFVGKTGLVEFSSLGHRQSYDFIITRWTTSHVYHETKQWNKLGTASVHLRNTEGPRAFEAFLMDDLPKPRHLRIVTIIHPPFTMIKKSQHSFILGTSCASANSVICIKYVNTTSSTMWKFHITHENKGNTEFHCCYGVMIDILLMIQKETGFTFDLYIVRDGKFGSLDKSTNQMNGMIGDVARGEADMALATVTITHERYKYVDFTTPYMGTSLAFLVKRERIKKYPFPESLKDMRLMKPFSVLLWLACVGTFLTVATVVWLFDKISFYRNIKSEHFLPFEYMAYVFGNIFHVPLTIIQAKTFAVPFLMVCTNFGALVLISSYTANLLVSLIVVDEVSIVKGVEDKKLLDPPDDFTFGTIKYSSTEDFFRNSENSRLRKIFKNMEKHGVNNFSEGIEKVRSGKLSVFIGESDALQYEIAEDPKCSIKFDGKKLELSGLAFALRKNSDWNQEISKAIHKLSMKEEIGQAFQRWMIRSCNKGENNIEPFGMGFDEFGGFLFNTALCCFGCFGIMGLEIFFYRRLSRNRKKFQIKCQSKSDVTLINSVSMETITINSLDVGSNRKISNGKQNGLPVLEKTKKVNTLNGVMNGSTANILDDL